MVLFGGANPASAGKVWLFNLKTKVWTSLPKLSGNRHGMGVTPFRGMDGQMKIIASSGGHGLARYRDTQILDVESQTLSPAADYPAVSCSKMSSEIAFSSFCNH